MNVPVSYLSGDKNMFTHIMIDSNDLERARNFYDATCTALGGKPRSYSSLARSRYHAWWGVQQWEL